MFIRSFRVNYAFESVNKNTGTKYYAFEKSERLNNIIDLYNKVKFAV